MSFFLHSKDYLESLKQSHAPGQSIADHKWILAKEDLAEFSSLYLDDKHREAKAKLVEMGGVEGISFALHTSTMTGLSQDDQIPENIEMRTDRYGKNVIEKKPPKSFLGLCWDLLQDPMLILLIACGCISIIAGIIEAGQEHGAKSTSKCTKGSLAWLEGGAVLIAVAVVTLVGALNDYKKDKQFRDMEKKSEDKKIRVIRSGQLESIQHHDVLVGDLLNIQQGDLVPCDGVVVKPVGVPKFTEAALTGETTNLLKNVHDHPFIVKGSQCVGGEVFLLCTGVGSSTSYGKLMSGLMGDRKKQKEAEERGEEYNPADDDSDPCCPLCCDNDEEDDRTPLQVKLDVLANQVGYCGEMAALILFHAYFFIRFAENGTKPAVNSDLTQGEVLVLAAWTGVMVTLPFVPVFWFKAQDKMQALFKICGSSDHFGDAEDPQDEEEDDSYLDIHSAFWDSPYLWFFVYTLCFYLVYMDLLMVILHPNFYWVQSLTLAVSIIVVAVPEGLPLAVLISLSYSMTKMYKENNFVRVLAACETMGNATTICSDKTGTLTTNMMTVQRLYAAGNRLFMEKEVKAAKENMGNVCGHDFAELLGCSIACNSKAMEVEGLVEGRTDFESEEERATYEYTMEKKKVLGILLQGETNQTESACLLFTMQRLGAKDNYKQYRSNYPMVKLYPFDSAIKMSSIFVQHREGVFRLYIKGAAERIVNACTRQAESSNGKRMDECKITEFGEDERAAAKKTMNGFARGGLRCLGFGYREFKEDEIELKKNPDTNRFEPSVDFDVAKDIIFLGIVGIKDPVRDSVPEAVKQCQSAGIVVRMVTGDHLETAKHIAKECGILTNPNQQCTTGAEFREYMKNTKEGPEKRKYMEDLRVVARSRPDDKELMVGWYKYKHNDVVAVTGDGANDALALQEAHVGLAMNIQGTDVAKEASDIVIMDDNFASIVNTVKWGRCVYDNIRKFVQFQVTVNIVALTLSLVGGFAKGKQLPLTAVQLLWVNLVMDVLAALALSTEQPTDELLERRPYDRKAHIISPPMIRFMAVHSTVQLIILFIILFAGEDFLDLRAAENYDLYRDSDTMEIENWSNRPLKVIVFNTFVWFQIFNEVNARKVNGEWNVIEGFFSNYMFSLIMVVIIVLQIFMVSFPVLEVQCFFSTFVGPNDGDGLTLDQWIFCIVMGATSFPVGQMVLWFPADMEYGMIDIDEEWFLVDEEFVNADSKMDTTIPTAK